MLMDIQMETAIISGLMVPHIRVILNKELDVALAFGKKGKKINKIIEEIINSIKKMAMVFMFGIMIMFIKEIFGMI